MSNEKFSEIFQARMADIERRLYQAGSTVTEICANVGVARATPVRWKRRLPKTIQLVDQLEAEVEKIEARQKKAAAKAAK